MTKTSALLTDAPYAPTQKQVGARGVVRFIASILLALLLASTLLPGGTIHAYAADDGDKKTIEKLEESKKSLGVTESGNEGFSKTVAKANQEKGKATFSSVITRVLTPGYIYQHPKSSTDGYYKGNKSWSCDVNDPNKGLLTYHNCDVPNFTADLGQNLYGTLTPTGIQRGGAESAKIELAWLGMPTGVNKVPAAASARADKYTAMELFGYNLRLTYYAGEFDHIQVLTEARLMSNFGASQTLALGVSSIFNGATTGATTTVNTYVEEVKKGNWLAGIGTAFSAGAEAAGAGAINTILDTSDANVMATRGYNRVDIDKTLYNARALTNSETEQAIINTAASMLAGNQPESAKLPDDLKKLQTPPAQPATGGTTCIVTNPDGTLNTISKLENEEACKEAAKTANMENPQYKWDGENKPSESIKDWREHNKEWFDAANKYQLNCPVDEDEAKREDTLSKFYACVPTAYESAAKKWAQEKESEAGKELAKKLEDVPFIRDFLKKNTTANFNNPVNHYICLNPDGTDKLDQNGKPEKLFTESGSYNPNCTATRSPIKGGVYGTGDGIMTDTRRALYDPNLANVVFNNQSAFTDFANAGIATAAFITRIANAALNIGMSPILQTFGVDNLIAEFIELFTKSGLYPFALIFGIAGLTYLLAKNIFGARKGHLREMIRYALSVIAIVIVASVTLVKPHETIHAVDKFVTVLDDRIADTLITGAIGDEICSTKGATETFKYATAKEGSEPATRTLMCEVWRMNLLTPWAYAQWGVNINDLYAVDAKRPASANTFINTNSSQVGRAPVQMGRGVTVNNWGLYQLQLQSSGTTTEDNPNQTAGVTNPGMYRIVDLQAGQDNGAGTDPRYLNHWAGKETGSRALTGALAPIAAGATGITVGYYAIMKAVVRVVLLLSLVILPLVMLLALLGKVTKQGTRKYVGTIIGLYIQSALLTFMLCLQALLLILLSSGATSYVLIFVVQVVTSVLLLLLTRRIMKYIMRGNGIAGTVNMTDTKNILSKTRAGRNFLSASKRAPGDLKHSLARGYAENGIVGATKETAKTFNPIKPIDQYNRRGVARTVATARKTGLETARRAVEKKESYQTVSKLADEMLRTEAAQYGRATDDSSVSKLETAKDIRRANKAVKAYDKAVKKERKDAEKVVQDVYDQRKNDLEARGLAWEEPTTEERESAVLEELDKRKRTSEATRAISQDTVEKQTSQRRAAKEDRLDIQTDDRFTAPEKAVHKIVRNEGRIKNTLKASYAGLLDRTGEKFENHASSVKRIETPKVEEVEIPVEVEYALLMSDKELIQLSVEELNQIKDWLESQPETPEYKKLLEGINEALRYKDVK